MAATSPSDLKINPSTILSKIDNITEDQTQYYLKKDLTSKKIIKSEPLRPDIKPYIPFSDV